MIGILFYYPLHELETEVKKFRGRIVYTNAFKPFNLISITSFAPGFAFVNFGLLKQNIKYCVLLISILRLCINRKVHLYDKLILKSFSLLNKLTGFVDANLASDGTLRFHNI